MHFQHFHIKRPLAEENGIFSTFDEETSAMMDIYDEELNQWSMMGMHLICFPIMATDEN